MSYIMSKDRGIVQEGEMSGECLRGICPGGMSGSPMYICL